MYRPPGTDEGTCTNFIITASDIHGPWSDPHVIEGAPGIDPDIFFDDDGKAWYVGTAAPDKANYPGEGAQAAEVACIQVADANGFPEDTKAVAQESSTATRDA